MAISNFIPEVWAASLLSNLKKNLVYGGLANRDYEGEISAFGDTVHITSIAAPTITPYSKDTNLSDPQALTDADRTLVIDQSQSFNFQIDDIDLRQSRNGGALMDEASMEAAYGLADVADTYLSGVIAAGSGIASLGTIDASSAATNVYDLLLVPARVALQKAKVPTAGRFIVLDSDTMGKLLLDSRFIKANEAGTDSALRNGFVGRAAGLDIYESPNNAVGNARTAISITTSTTNATTKRQIVAAAGTFTQADVGAGLTGTGVGASARITAVNADGSTATVDVDSTAAATVADGAVVVTGLRPLVTFGYRGAITFAEQIAKVEAYRPEKRFADALKGLHLYGAKVTRPGALGTARVKVA